jgi:hypothetical protein
MTWMFQPRPHSQPWCITKHRLRRPAHLCAACSPIRFWAVAAAAPAGDATTHAFVDALCPDILEALVHCLLVLQGCSPEVSTSTVATWHAIWGHALGAEMQPHIVHHPTICAMARYIRARLTRASSLPDAVLCSTVSSWRAWRRRR